MLGKDFEEKGVRWAPHRYVIIDPNTCLGLTSI